MSARTRLAIITASVGIALFAGASLSVAQQSPETGSVGNPGSSLSASSYNISYGQSVTLYYQSYNESYDTSGTGYYVGDYAPANTSCTANFPISQNPNGGLVCTNDEAWGCISWQPNGPLYDGSYTTGGLTQTTTYTFSCSNNANGGGGSSSQSVTINVAPLCAADSGQSCSATSGANACGQTNTNYGTYNCSGVCTASTPSVPSNPGYYGQSCSSSANSCGQTNTGTYNCSAVCSASVPSNSSCPPSTPTFAYLYDDANGSYVGSSGSAYHSAGYRIYFRGTSPDGSNVAVYYELYNAQTGSVYAQGWATPVWNGSGSWAEYVDSFANFAPGSYDVAAYTYDADGQSSGWSSWQGITLSTPALSVSCSVSPTTTTVNTPVTWSASASGGSGTGYTYSWSGTNLSGSGASTQASYASGGTYTGSVTVHDSVGDSSGGVACSNSVSVTPVPTATLSVSPSTIISGQSASLTWSSTNASSCTAVGGFSTGGAANNGSGVSTGALTSTSQYQIYCDGPSGRGYSNIATVTVLQPSAYITITPARVAQGGSATVAWSANNINSCTVTGTDGYSSGSISGPTIATTTHALTNLTSRVTYTMSCGSSASSAATVQVNPTFTNF